MKKQIVILIVALVVFVSSTTVVLINSRLPKGIESVPEVTTMVVSEEEYTKEHEIGDRTTEAIISSEKFTTEMVIDDIDVTEHMTEEVVTESATSSKPGTECITTTQYSSPETQGQSTNNTTNHNSNAGQSSNAASSGANNPPTIIVISEPSSTEAEKQWVPPVTEMVWVVDREEYTETYPVYEMVPAERCHGCGGIFYTADDLYAHIDASAYDNCGGYTYEPQTVEVGTTEITYPEEGHWEPVVIEEGYWK
ncbi:MAG: hypothetical protein IJO70_00535 [Lachnospiraceae bacterium]|nr:hypothetical protein [Lachnospiraceae bacterium]